MRAIYNMGARKRPVNLTLNEDLVSQARGVTDNLSAAVESLLADFVSREKQKRAADAKVLNETIATWNDFADPLRTNIRHYKCRNLTFIAIVAKTA